MPGPIVHLIVQQRLAAHLRQNAILMGLPTDLADLLDAEPCSPYSGFGSMGPDFLFFSMREYGSIIGNFTNFIFDAYDALEPYIKLYKDAIEPIVDAINSVATSIDNALFAGLFGDLRALSAAINTTAITAIGTNITNRVDIFYAFYPKVQAGAAEKDWYWFDFLHYRRTGKFCDRLWEIAMGARDDDLRRYVLGYASHIGTDVVGHPFVNSIVGGPYRMHWKRHKLVENWIDAYARTKFPDSPGTKGCLNLTGDDTYVANAINGSHYYRLCAFPEGKLPHKLGDMILKAMDDIYTGGDHPVTFSFDDLDDTYRLWLKWFERVTTFGSMHPPPPVPPPGSAALALVNNLLSGLPSFPGGGGGGGGGGFSIRNILAAVLSFVQWLGNTVNYIASWTITNIGQIAALPITEALALLKWLVYQLHKGVYQIYDNLRWSLVLGGYFFPEPQDLTKEPWGRALLNTSFVGQLGGFGAADYCAYPHKQVEHYLTDPNTLKSTEHHLRYPTTPVELPFTESMPQPMYGVFPDAFISGTFAFNPVIDQLDNCIKPYDLNVSNGRSTPDDCIENRSGDPLHTHEIAQDTWNTPQFGNAMNFSARLILRYLDTPATMTMPDFNLDGDRGYAWKAWRAEDPTNIEANNPVPIENDRYLN